MNLYDELLALVDALEEHRVEYAICGLSKMKRIAGRRQDLADIERLEAEDHGADRTA